MAINPWVIFIVSRITDETINEVMNRTDALAVVGDYVRLEQKGGRYWGCCPFHSEKTPSFTVDPDRKTYYCFGCHEGGGIINFVMEMDKLSYPQAIEALAKRAGVTIIRDSSAGESTAASREAEKEDRLKTDMEDLYRRVSTSFSYFLTEKNEGKNALNYVLERGISRGMVDRFHLGFAPADRFWLHKFLRSKGYSDEFLTVSGLFAKNNAAYSFFADRLIFPIADKTGRTVAFGGRILSGDGPKYLNSGESVIFKKRETLFALHLALPEIRASKEVIIAEGYMDVIALHQAGITNAVAPLGTAFTEDQAKLLGRWAQRILFLFDIDEAGQTAAWKAVLTCRKIGVGCAVIVPEPLNGQNFKDPADILRTFGAEVLKKIVKNVILEFEYLLTRSRRNVNVDDSGGNAKAAALLFPYIDLLDSEIERASCFKRIADSFETDPAAVLEDFKNWLEIKKFNNKRSFTGSGENKTVVMNNELYLLTAVVVNFGINPQLWNDVRVAIPLEEFEDLNARELYIALEECSRNDTKNLDAVLRKLNDVSLKNFVALKSTTLEFQEKPDVIVSDGIKTIKGDRLKRKRQGLIAKMRVAKNSNLDTSELVQEKMFIDNEIKKLKETVK
ncbi:DNA primase [Spirochaetia bacterium]|nr:DNA primase [Spirochaetia bacterium]